MKSRKKFINAIVAAVCAAVLAAGAFIGIFANRSSVSAQAAEGANSTQAAEETKNLSYEEYARLLHVNDLKEAGKSRPEAYDELYQPAKEQIVYNRQKGNNWGYLSLVASLASKALGFVGFPAIGVGALKAGADFLLRESLLQKVGEATAEMLNKTVDVLSYTINEDFKALKAEIDKQTVALNNSISSATQIIVNVVKKESYTNAITAFNSTAFVNASNKNCGYRDWQDALEKMFDAVVEAEANTSKDSAADLADLKSAYDNLYYVAESTNLTLYKYIIGNTEFPTNEDSILEILYNYYLLSVGKTVDNFNLDNALKYVLDYAQDLYSSYLFGNTCMQLAYMFQTEYQTKTASNNSYKLDNGVIVPKGDVESYFNGEYDGIEKKIDNVEKELMKFYARVLALSETYTYKGSDGTIYGDVVYNTLYNNAVPGSVKVKADDVETLKHVVCHNTVQKGDTLYMQGIPDALTTSMNASLYFKSSDESLATVTKDGTVTVVGDSGSFVISLVAGEGANDVVYSRTFNIGVEAFSGGFGTEAVPYRISNINDLRSLAGSTTYWAEGCHYVLTKDIDLNGENFGYIGREFSYFNGVFDGNNHYIMNNKRDALFETIGGTVKNLNLSNCVVTNEYTSRRDGRVYIYGGILCLFNRGTIENCHVIGGSVKGDLRSKDGNSPTYIFYGAIAANYGKVINSSVSGVSVSSSFVSVAKQYPNISSFSGALVGLAADGSLITDCLARHNNVYSYIHNRSLIDGSWDAVETKIETTASFILGGFVGETYHSATLNRCIAYGNYLDHKWDHTEDDNNLFNNVKSYEQAHIYQFAGYNAAKMTSCYSSEPTTAQGNKDADITMMPDQDKAAFEEKGWNFKSASEPTLKHTPVLKRETKTITAVLPIKTHYYSGEELNLAGLAVLSDNGQVLSNAKVTLLDTLTLAENQKEKDVPVQVDWNNLSTTFNVKVSCPHDYVEDEKQRVEGNCVTEGKKVYICQVAGCNDIQTITTKAEGHQYKQVVTEATCVSDGYTTHTCELCGDSFVDSQVPALGHAYTEKAVAPTCTAEGYTEHTCSRCGYSYRDNEVTALGHDMVHHDSKAPTCTEVGWYAYDACSRGDSTTYREIAALGHVWGDWAITKSPTCTVAGERRRICNRDSNHVDLGSVDPLGHDWGEWNQLKAPNCSEDGQRQRICVHDNSHKDNEAIPALGHAWGEWIETKAVTCTEGGHEYRICGRVNEHREDRDITALGHDTTHYEGKAPTYTEKGWKAYDTCNRCDYTTYQELEALGLAQKFKDEVATIEDNPLSGIKAALTTYSTLTAEDKEKVVAEYAKLEEEIKAYNQKAEKLNQSYENALSVALKATAAAVAAVSALAATAFVLGKKG